MTVEECIAERLEGIPAVVALVSTRVYLQLLPQRPEMPAVRIALVGEQRGYHQRGESNFQTTRIQVDAYAERSTGTDAYADANQLADLIAGRWPPGSTGSAGLSGWRGTAGGSPPSLEILGIFVVDRSVQYEPDEFRLVRVRQDFRVVWRYL